MKPLNESIGLKLNNSIQQQDNPFSQNLLIQGQMDDANPQVQQQINDGIPLYIAEELYFDDIYQKLTTSNEDLIYKVMDQEFDQVMQTWKHQNIDTFEIANLTQICRPILYGEVPDQELSESSQLYSRLTGFIYKYLKETRQLTSKQLAAFA